MSEEAGREKGPKYCSLCKHNSGIDWCELLGCDTAWTVGRRGLRPNACPLPPYEKDWEDEVFEQMPLNRPKQNGKKAGKKKGGRVIYIP